MDATRTQSRKTNRSDYWWIEPALVATGFTLFIIYATYRALEGNFYQWGPYLSPFYSPRFVFSWWHFSPAILILWIPAGFRATCYYYRKAYYRAYFLDPPACAVADRSGKSYKGETRFPFLLQNLHRYFLYLAIFVLLVLWSDTIATFTYKGSLYMGLGSLVFLANVCLLTGYTFGCHALRHIVGGGLDCFSCSAGHKLAHGAWGWVTKLNEHHMFWAWVSLFSVALTDLYVRQVACGALTDLRIF
jgi:hypothetical protein